MCQSLHVQSLRRCRAGLFLLVITATAGNRSFVREIEGGNSGNQNDLVAHFGLGPLAKPVTVRVRFPSGKVGTWQAGLRSTFVAKESQLK